MPSNGSLGVWLTMWSRPSVDFHNLAGSSLLMLSTRLQPGRLSENFAVGWNCLMTYASLLWTTIFSFISFVANGLFFSPSNIIANCPSI